MTMKNIVLASLLVLFSSVGIWSQDHDPRATSAKQDPTKTLAFATIDKDDALYQGALDAHDLNGTLKLVGKDGAFRGTVDRLYEVNGGMLILDFDPNYKTAITAILKRSNASKFEGVRDLKGKEIVITGKFIEYQGKAEIELSDPKQIKIVK